MAKQNDGLTPNGNVFAKYEVKIEKVILFYFRNPLCN